MRSMTNKEGNHQRATYQLHTGYVPTATLKHPHLGCSIAAELGESKFDLPHIVSIGGATIGAGFLGASLEPFVVQNPEQAPGEHPAEGRGRSLPAPARAAQSPRDRRLRTGRRGRPGARPPSPLYPDGADGPLAPDEGLSPGRARARATRDAYGRNPFGQGCLLARRLVAGRGHLRRGPLQRLGHAPEEQRAGGEPGPARSIPAFATLIRDLKERGMLDRTLVVWMGEFGRTPKINPQRRPRPLPEGLQRGPGRRRHQGRSGHRSLQRRRHRGQGPPRHRPRPDGLALPRPSRRRDQGNHDRRSAGRSRSSTAARSSPHCSLIDRPWL